MQVLIKRRVGRTGEVAVDIERPIDHHGPRTCESGPHMHNAALNQGRRHDMEGVGRKEVIDLKVSWPLVSSIIGDGGTGATMIMPVARVDHVQVGRHIKRLPYQMRQCLAKGGSMLPGAGADFGNRSGRDKMMAQQIKNGCGIVSRSL